MLRKVGILSIVALFVSLFVTSAVFAKEGEPLTPTSLEGGKILSAEAVKAVVDAGNLAIYDMRKAMNFEKGHIKGAISLPYDQKSELNPKFDASKDKYDLAQLPKDKNKALVFYSDGPTGWKSYKMAVIAIREGYKKVIWFRGGTAEWTEKKLPLE